MTPELIARATGLGVTRGRTGQWWTRENYEPNLVGFDGRRWWWAPEAWRYADVVHYAPRFATEAEALSAALAWLDSGEPALGVTP